MNKIKRFVARANVSIAFFTHLHIVMIRDDKNVRKIRSVEKYLFYQKLFVSFKEVVNYRTCRCGQ